MIFGEKEERQPESVIALFCILFLVRIFLFWGLDSYFALDVKLTKFLEYLERKSKKRTIILIVPNRMLSKKVPIEGNESPKRTGFWIPKPTFVRFGINVKNKEREK